MAAAVKKGAIEIASLAAYEESVKAAGNKTVVVFFWADWHEASKGMLAVVEAAAQEHGSSVQILQVEAEQVSDLAEKLGVESVPCSIFLQGGKVVAKSTGANPAGFIQQVQSYAATPAAKTVQAASQSSSKATTNINDRLAKLVKAAPVMLFMKGSPSDPKCKFSRATVELLKTVNATYGYFDILTDNDVREGLKKFSNWPTYPQLYVDGKLVGGLDVLKEMAENGELADALPKGSTKSGLDERLKALVNQAPVMLFMKGEPSAPQCGFSAKIVGLLNDAGAKYGHFDILTDNEVRQGLKVYSNWPTYPQLYVKGKLIGGLDVVTEMAADGELEDLFADASAE